MELAGLDNEHICQKKQIYFTSLMTETSQLVLHMKVQFRI